MKPASSFANLTREQFASVDRRRRGPAMLPFCFRGHPKEPGGDCKECNRLRVAARRAKGK